MIHTHQVEKKVPLTVLESKIGERSFSFVCESDASLEQCHDALKEIEEHVLKLIEDAKKQEDSLETAVEG